MRPLALVLLLASPVLAARWTFRVTPDGGASTTVTLKGKPDGADFSATARCRRAKGCRFGGPIAVSYDCGGLVNGSGVGLVALGPVSCVMYGRCDLRGSVLYGGRYLCDTGADGDFYLYRR